MIQSSVRRSFPSLSTQEEEVSWKSKGFSGSSVLYAHSREWIIPFYQGPAEGWEGPKPARSRRRSYLFSEWRLSGRHQG
jgi:hypothetical protein